MVNDHDSHASEGNGNDIPSHLKRTCESLTRRQRELYNRCPSLDVRIMFLEGITEERKKSEIGSELIGLVLYTLITGLIVLIYGLFFKNEESTKYFIVLLNSVYYIAKIVILGASMERLGIIYDNKIASINGQMLIEDLIESFYVVFLGIKFELLTKFQHIEKDMYKKISEIMKTKESTNNVLIIFLIVMNLT
ncbi:11890_t:CDS:2 [Funneliformis mosseae]|uniref:11890_t:CDS:1 n=1 Tax=Funneliformis mosseae TaxID=27381 RepID=A0A9N9GFI3_FUNMO|nr:11890_t:CDS:2 [Funneliformis mosseae]